MAIAVRQFPHIPEEGYDALRPRIASGDLLLCSGTAFFSELIKQATGSCWSHVAFVLRLDAIDRVMVLESVESRGVRTMPLRNYVTDYNGTGAPYPGRILIARHGGLDRRKLKALSKKAVDLFGFPYDKDEIARIAFRITAGAAVGKLGFKMRGRLKRDREYICSEYAEECFRSVGVKIKPAQKGFVVPADFARQKHVHAVGVVGGLHQRPTN